MILKNMAFAAALGALALVPQAGSAESQAERFARLLSQDFAQQSRAHLGRGDRAAAILAALRGLPDDPTAADLQTYPDAYAALLTAAVSRSLQLPMTMHGASVLDPTGQRLATIGGQWGAAAQFDRAEPLTLWHAVTGARIATLMEVRDTTTQDVGPSLPVFSPDGRFIAMTSDVIDQVVLFRAEDGRELWRRPANRARHTGLAFSADSTRLITAGHDPAEGNTDALQVIDVATGQPVFSFVTSERDSCAYVAVPGGRGSEVYYLRSAVFDDGACDGGQRRIFVVAGNAAQELFVFDQVTDLLVDLGATLNSTAELALLATENYDTRLVTRDGTIVADLSPADTGEELAEFSGDEARLIAPRYGASDAVVGVQAFDLSGMPVAPSVEDLLGFAHGVHYPTGEMHSMANEEMRAVLYRGADMPRGPALYDYVWQAIPEALRAEINADRVPR